LNLILKLNHFKKQFHCQNTHRLVRIFRKGPHKSRVNNGSGNSRRNSLIKPAISCAFVEESKVKLRLELT
jgi:hypothetical protein